MAFDAYQCLRIRLDRGVCFATIDHPPINLLDVALMQEIDRLGREVEADPAVRVVVLDSAEPPRLPSSTDSVFGEVLTKLEKCLS